jgi:hypothetical protein
MSSIGQYLRGDYMGDLTDFLDSPPREYGIAGLICGRTIESLLTPDQIGKYADPERFLCVQYGMNLLNQAIWTYFRSAHWAWISSCAPFLTSRCPSAHGGILYPESVLRYAARPLFRNHLRIVVSESLVEETEAYFIPAYPETLPGMERHFSAGLISGNALVQAILNDKDCLGFAMRYARRQWKAGGSS